MRGSICRRRTMDHIHVMPRSYESIRAELDDIVERYRAYTGRDVGKGG